jgi:hypothetical protein
MLSVSFRVFATSTPEKHLVVIRPATDVVKKEKRSEDHSSDR